MISPSPTDAQLSKDDGSWTLVLKRELRHPAPRVWAALTDADQLVDWGPFIADRDLISAGPVRLTDRGVAQPRTVEGKIHQAEPPYLLVYEWGGDTLRWELSDHGSGTLLVLRHRFSDRQQAPSYAAGWHLCLDALGASLAGTPMPSVVGDAAMAQGWPELRDHYSEQLLDVPAS
jgi:uncharacterized protein YndB with AHSA1/START domain